MNIFIVNTLNGVLIFAATLIYCNNYGAIQIIHNDVFYECTEHIEINCHFIRHYFPHDLLPLQPISNIFTMSLALGRFYMLFFKLKVALDLPH